MGGLWVVRGGELRGRRRVVIIIMTFLEGVIELARYLLPHLASS